MILNSLKINIGRLIVFLALSIHILQTPAWLRRYILVVGCEHGTIQKREIDEQRILGQRACKNKGRSNHWIGREALIILLKSRSEEELYQRIVGPESQILSSLVVGTVRVYAEFIVAFHSTDRV